MTKINVVIFGESGSGKSSLVNLLLGTDAAKVSDEAIGCTFQFQKFETPKYNLFDTVGLSEGVQGTKKQEFAVKALIDLLKSLEEGVSLLIFVMEKGRIKKSLDENYKLFVNAICMNSVPVLLAVTHCEMESTPGTWWMENKTHFDKYGMNFKAVVSGCALQPASVPLPMQSMITSLNQSTAIQLCSAIDLNLMLPGWRVAGGWKSWLYTVIKNVLQFFGKLLDIPLLKNYGSDDPPSFEERLYLYFRSQEYGISQAREMAIHISRM